MQEKRKNRDHITPNDDKLSLFLNGEFVLENSLLRGTTAPSMAMRIKRVHRRYPKGNQLLGHFSTTTL